MQFFSRSLLASFPIAAALVIGFQSPNLAAQDDQATIIREGTNPDVIRLGAEERVVRIENPEDLLVRSVAQTQPTTAVELAKAIRMMLDIERIDKAKQYLESLSQLELDGVASYKLNQDVGSDVIYMIARAEELQPLGRETALKIFAAATEWANSESRIDELIQSLDNESVYVRSDAFAKLRRIGSVSVARLLEVFSSEGRKSEFPGLRGALYAFGEEAVGPMLGAADCPILPMRIEAIRGLAKQESNEAVDMLLRQSLSQKTPKPLREFATRQLKANGVVPNRVEVESRLATRVEKFLSGGRESADSLIGSVTFWNWDADSNRLESKTVDADVAARIRAAKIAQTLFEIDPSNARHRELHLLSQLESLKRQAGPAGQIDVDEFFKAADDIDAQEVASLLDKAMDMDLMPASIACCEVLKKVGDESQVISGLRDRRLPLVNAILQGDRHLQFAALDAIIEINPKSAFAGSSFVSELAAYLASSHFKRATVVGHIHNEVSQAWAGAVGPAGWSGVPAYSSQELFRQATSNPDISVILISDTLNRPANRELIQQLRRHWKTRRMPIGVLARDAQHLLRSSRYTEGIDRLLTFPLSMDFNDIAGQMSQLAELRSSWPVSNDDRYRHAARAVSWLEKATVDPEMKFYNFGSHQEQLLGLLYHPEFTSSAATILASQPTPKAQRAMLGFVSQGDLPIDARNTVADAFVLAVKRGGTMLTTSEIELQYERYNASETQPVETQEVLGRVLDAIEARRNASRR